MDHLQSEHGRPPAIESLKEPTRKIIDNHDPGIRQDFVESKGKGSSSTSLGNADYEFGFPEIADANIVRPGHEAEDRELLARLDQSCTWSAEPTTSRTTNSSAAPTRPDVATNSKTGYMPIGLNMRDTGWSGSEQLSATPFLGKTTLGRLAGATEWPTAPNHGADIRAPLRDWRSWA